MGEFGLVVGVMHIYLIATHTTPLEHSPNRYDITTATRWKNCQSTSPSVVAKYLLHQHAFILRDYTVAASVA